MTTKKTPNMTKIRQATLDVITVAGHPLSANEVLARILLPCNPATIYRSLHYLEGKGYAHSFVLHCAEHGTERYYMATTPENHHHHWFHCEQCHRFIDLGDCSLAPLIQEYQEKLGIQVTRDTLYLTGICATCQN